MNPKSTSNQSSKPCTVLQYPSRKVKSLTHGSSSREHSKQKTPPGGGVSFDQYATKHSHAVGALVFSKCFFFLIWRAFFSFDTMGILWSTTTVHVSTLPLGLGVARDAAKHRQAADASMVLASLPSSCANLFFWYHFFFFQIRRNDDGRDSRKLGRL